MVNDTYHGTYPIRSLTKGEKGIHMPSHLSGDYAIYEMEDGTIRLDKVGDREKKNP